MNRHNFPVFLIAVLMGLAALLTTGCTIEYVEDDDDYYEDEYYDEYYDYLPPNRDSRTMSMICHLSSFAGALGIVPFGNIVVPLIIWLVKKDDPFVDHHGREVLNFQISIFIYTIIAAVLCFVLIGFLLLPIVMLANLILTIVAAIRAKDGERYQYPMTIRFF